MKIEQIDVYHVAMPMLEPWRTAFGEMDQVDSILVRLVAEGQVGWGEAAPYASPQYCPEFAAGAFAIIRDWLGPALLGQEVTSGDELQVHLAPYKGNHFAKSALDVAWWDAFAKMQDKPLWQLIGGTTSEIAVGADIAVLETLDRLLDAVAAAQEAGFARTKLKFRRNWGAQMVERVRDRFPDAVIHVDCNCGFSPSDTAMFEELDRFGLKMIEQPLGYDDLFDHAVLQRRLHTPLCLDESIVSLDRARKALSLGACGWINLKVGRLGGLTPAIAVHDYCRERDVPCWVGGMLESAVGQGASIALSTLANVAYPSDIFPSDRFYAEDLAQPDVVLSGPGRVRAPDRSGLGFAPLPERLARLSVAHAVVERRALN